MAKGIDRISVEKGDREVYNDLENSYPLKGLHHSDLLCLAMSFGFDAGLRTPLGKKDGLIRLASLKESQWRLIRAIAIAEMNQLQVIADDEECITIAEEYANAGLRIIQEAVESSVTDELETTIQRKILSINERINNTEGDPTDGRKPEDEESEYVLSLTEGGESEKVEFKSSMRWDYKQKKSNRRLEYVIAKSIGGFLNARGGVLLIGVDDKGDILGLQEDYGTLKKKDNDGFQAKFWELVDTLLGIQHKELVSFKITEVEEKEVCVVEISESPEPVYVRTENKNTIFPLRSGNRTRSLQPHEIEEYRKRRW